MRALALVFSLSAGLGPMGSDSAAIAAIVARHLDQDPGRPAPLDGPSSAAIERLDRRVRAECPS